MSNVTALIFDVGKRALLTHQQGIRVTSHNIANANTPLYSRQRLNLETSEPVVIRGELIGTGVSTGGIQRIGDTFLNRQIFQETSGMKRWETRNEILSQAEAVMNDAGGTGLNQAMTDFWNAWEDLADNPTGTAEREVLIGVARSMASRFQQTENALARIELQAENSVSGLVVEVNELAADIARLNNQIGQLEGSGQAPNDLLDRRDALVAQLSEKIDIDIADGGAGIVNITAAGNVLVTGVFSNEINREDLNLGLQGGELRGYIEAAEAVAGYRVELTSLAGAIRDRVNALHTSGYDLDGNGPDINPPSPSIPFFSTSGGEILAVNPDLTIRKIAASASGGPGDNANALAISELLDQPMGPPLSLSSTTSDALTTDFENFTVRWTPPVDPANPADTGSWSIIRSYPGAEVTGDATSLEISVDGTTVTTVTFPEPLTNGTDLVFDIQNGEIVNALLDSPSAFYNGLVSRIGNDVATAERNTASQSDLVDELENLRQSIAGVSLDEELISLIEFQNAFEAAAKIITTADELMQTLINMTP